MKKQPTYMQNSTDFSIFLCYTYTDKFLNFWFFDFFYRLQSWTYFFFFFFK